MSQLSRFLLHINGNDTKQLFYVFRLMDFPEFSKVLIQSESSNSLFRYFRSSQPQMDKQF